MLKRVSACIGLSLGLLVATTNAQRLPVISVCELIASPDKWAGKIVAVRGSMSTLFNDAIVGMGVFLGPRPSDRCSYPDSKYISSDEPAQVMLDYPDGHFLNHPPTG